MGGASFFVMDTGGWLAGGDTLDAKVAAQAERALAEADVILMVVDANDRGDERRISPSAKVIRRSGVAVRLVANKVDGENKIAAAAWEFVSLGLGDPWPVSALHGRGMGELLDEVVTLLAESVPPHRQGDAAPGVPRVALVGRPNAGKSTLFNRLIGEDRSIVHDQPGTTPDASTRSSKRRTARCASSTPPGCASRPRRIRDRAHSVLRALDALERADLAILVIDATVGAYAPGSAVGRAHRRVGLSGHRRREQVGPGRGRRARGRAGRSGDRLAFLGAAPVLKMSALSGKGVHRILPALRDSVQAYHQRVPTGALNRTVQELQATARAPGEDPLHRPGRDRPADVHALHERRLPPTYLRYIERGIREKFDFGATPMKLRVRVGGK